MSGVGTGHYLARAFAAHWWHPWHILGAVAGSSLLGSAVFGALRASAQLGQLQRGLDQGSYCMSSNPLVAELQALRQELASLSSRVLQLEEQVGTQRSGIGSAFTSPTPVTVNYVGSPLAELPPFPTFESGSQSLPSPSVQSPATSVIAHPTEEDRTRVAIEIGEFLARCLSGANRGSSGRSKIPLASRVYILVRDIEGRVFDPVQIHRSFASVRPLVKRGDSAGDAIFVGLPSIWEARLAVQAARLNWPADGAGGGSRA